MTCPHVKNLRAVEMLDPGTLRKITLQAFTAGAVNRKVSHMIFITKSCFVVFRVVSVILEKLML